MLAALLVRPNTTGRQPAAVVGSPRAACALYVRGVSFSEPMVSFRSPITDLCYTGFGDASKVATLRFILQHLATDPNAGGDDESWTPIISATYNGYIDVVRLLVEFGAKVNIWTDIDCSPLYYALRENRIELVEFLLEHGARARSVQDATKLQQEAHSAGAALLEEAMAAWGPLSD